MHLTEVVCLSICFAFTVVCQTQRESVPSIITIISTSACRSKCKNGKCTRQDGTALPNLVKCECMDGWGGDACDLPSGPLVLKSLVFPEHYSIQRLLASGNLALVEQRARNKEPSCAGNFVCYNGGFCTGGLVNGFRCQCIPPYTGTFCLHRCEKKCVNYGVCFRDVKFRNGTTEVNQVCKCPRQYQGEFCEHKL